MIAALTILATAWMITPDGAPPAPKPIPLATPAAPVSTPKKDCVVAPADLKPDPDIAYVEKRRIDFDPLREEILPF